MPAQDNYGTQDDDTVLVPGSLTAYRHFALLPMGKLAPMNYPDTDGIYVPTGEAREFEAKCLVLIMSGSTSLHMGMEYLAGTNIAHPAPQVDCKCGFYAHYAPDTDFYSGSTWNAGGGSSLGYNPFQYSARAGYSMVRAVVELSGKVVMGNLGVRAQKLKVKALTVDWDKYDSADWYDEPDLSFPFEKDFPAPTWGRTRVSPDVRDTYEHWCETAARRYGAEYFDNPKDMYEAYPQPDLSSLGLPDPPSKRERRPRPLFTTFDHAALARQANDSLTLIREAVDTFADAMKILAPAVAEAAKEASAFERVMEAKRNRPAPPGTGIDRRKRKL